MNDAWTEVNFLSGHVSWMDHTPQEDMLQVEYPNDLVLDMGWYGGEYAIYIVKDFEWDAPFAKYATQDADSLFELLEKAVSRIEGELQKFTSYGGNQQQ